MRPAVVVRGRSLIYNTARNDLLLLRRVFSSENRDGEDIETQVSEVLSEKKGAVQPHNGQVRHDSSEKKEPTEFGPAKSKSVLGLFSLDGPASGRGRGARLSPQVLAPKAAPIGAQPGTKTSAPAASPSIIGQPLEPEQGKKFDHLRGSMPTQGRGLESAVQPHNGQVRHDSSDKPEPTEVGPANSKSVFGHSILDDSAGGRGRGARLSHQDLAPKAAPIGAQPGTTISAPTASPSIIGQPLEPEEGKKFDHLRGIMPTQGRGRGSVILSRQPFFRPQPPPESRSDTSEVDVQHPRTREGRFASPSFREGRFASPPSPRPWAVESLSSTAESAPSSTPSVSELSSPSPPASAASDRVPSSAVPLWAAESHGAVHPSPPSSRAETSGSTRVGTSEGSLTAQPRAFPQKQPTGKFGRPVRIDIRDDPPRRPLAPEMGLELAQKLSAEPETRALRPVHLTTFRGEGIREKAGVAPGGGGLERAEREAAPPGPPPQLGLGAEMGEGGMLGAGRGKPLKPGSAGERARGKLLESFTQGREMDRPVPQVPTTTKEMRRRRGSAESFTGVYGDLAAGLAARQSTAGRGSGSWQARGGAERSSSRSRVRQPRQHRRQYEQQPQEDPAIAAREAAMAELSPEERKELEEAKEFQKKIREFDEHMGIEFEPEWFMEDFCSNPILDEYLPEKPNKEEDIRRFLEASKGTLMIWNGIRTDEEWEEHVAQALKDLPSLERVADHYGGPQRLSALQENATLAKVKAELPPTVPPELEKFVQRSLLTLQNNPHWQLTEKDRFFRSLVKNASAHAT